MAHRLVRSRSGSANGPSNPAGKLNARFRQVTEEFPHQEHVSSLQLVIIAELELVGFGYDQTLVGLAENALLLQAIGAPPNGFDRQTEKRDRAARETPCLILSGSTAWILPNCRSSSGSS